MIGVNLPLGKVYVAEGFRPVAGGIVRRELALPRPSAWPSPAFLGLRGS
jgi:hypothetical protein